MLHVHEHGDPAGRPLVALHGVTQTGRHFAELATRLPGRRVLAPDLLGHGDSRREPPWHLEEHVEALLERLGDTRADWLGHSFGARLAIEVAVRRPELVERLVLLDPALHVLPPVALWAAEHARRERAYASFEEAIERRWAESQLAATAPRALVEAQLRHDLEPGEDGLWRYRYTQAAVVAAYGEMSREPPPFDRVRVPTLLVLGRDSYVPYDHLLDAHRAALGELLEVRVLAAGHTLLWDAPEETADAVREFLG